MQLRTILVFILLSVLVINADGKILKALLKKKLALIPLLAKGKLGSGGGHKGSKNQSTSPQAASTGIQSGEVTNIIDESSLVEQIHPVPASVAVYRSYAPEYRTSSIYYGSSLPVVRRTVYEYVQESARDNSNDNSRPLAGAPGIPGIPSTPSVPSTPGLSSILGSSNLSGLVPGLSGLKGAVGRTLTALSAPVQTQEPASPRITTYISYPPY